MSTPGASSGTYNFNLANSQIVVEAYDRIGMRPTELDRHHFNSARTSLNLELMSWSNQGINLWKIVSGTINLVASQSVYTLPANIITITDLWFTTVGAAAPSQSTDRLLTPLTRSEYAALPMKLMPGTPTSYWFQRLQVPQVTIWQPPQYGAPNYVCNWYGLQQIQDAGIGGGETPDVVDRGLDALCAGMAVRLASKFAPDRQQMKMQEQAVAWEAFTRTDQEQGPVIFSPTFSGYTRL